MVSLLSDRPPAELERLRSRLEAERVRIDREAARVAVELEQVQEAQARQARRSGARSARTASSAPTARERVLKILRASPSPLSPAQIREQMLEDGFGGSNSAIHNALRKLVDAQTISRLGEGLYEAASPRARWEDALELHLENGDRATPGSPLVAGDDREDEL